MMLSPTLTPITTDTAPAPLRLAPVQEVFSSIQGEGLVIGYRQLFVRFAHCHLKCTYCDTPMHTPTGEAFVYPVSGVGAPSALPNPLTPEAFTAVILHALSQARHHSISLTGGEPLLYTDFLCEVAPVLSAACPLYLETSGTQPDRLAKLLPWLRYVAMDIKLPSATKEAPQFEAHTAFYKVLASAPHVVPFIKVVFDGTIAEDELAAIERIVTNRATPIFLQPMTHHTLPEGGGETTIACDAPTVLGLMARLGQTFSEVRVVPQTHKMLKVQ